MNVYIKKRGRGIAWCYTLFLSLMFLLPQELFAVVETVRYTMNPEDVTCISTIIGGEKYTRVEWKDKFSTQQEEGAPDIPCDHVSFLVPQNTQNFRVSVSTPNGNSVTRILGERVMPVQPMVSLNANPEDIKFVKADQSLYDNISVPHAEVMGDGFIFGNQHIVQVAVYPISYSDLDKTIRIESEIELSLEYDNCEASELTDTPLFPGSKSSDIEEAISQINFINTNSAARTITQQHDGVIVIPPASNQYYIIIPEKLLEGINDLVIWKKQKGYDVTVTTIESILSDPSYKIGTKIGPVSYIRDEAESLRTYLKDVFQQKGLFYCLLVGDWRTSMPIRKFYDPDFSEDEIMKNNYNGEYSVPSDDYFSDLTSSFTLNNSYTTSDQYLGKVSNKVWPDIYVGRLLCSSNDELHNYFEKLRIYESNPGFGDDDYLGTALYFENNPDCDGKGNSSLTSLVGKSVEPMNRLDIFTNILYARDRDVEQGYTEHTMPMMGCDIIRYMHRTGFNSWLGHGHPAGILTCGGNHFIIPISSYTRGVDGQVGRKEDENFIDKLNGLDMMDNVNYPSVAYSNACAIAPFDCMEEEHHIFDIPYNMAGAYTVSGLYGGVGIIANTRSAYIGPGQALQSQFNWQLSVCPQYGVSHIIAKYLCDSNDLRSKKSLNFIGDPEFNMWFNKPIRLNSKTLGKNMDLDLSDPNLYMSEVSIYDGQNVVYRSTITEKSLVLPTTVLNTMPVVSIWKINCLPIIKLYAPTGIFSNVRRRYMPNEAYLGVYQESNLSAPCIINNQSVIEIDAMKTVEIEDGFHVEAQGKVEISAQEEIRVSGELVRDGGEANLISRNVVLDTGFKIDKGAVLTINTFK